MTPRHADHRRRRSARGLLLSVATPLCLALMAGPLCAQQRVPGERWLRFTDVAEAGFDAKALEAARATWEQLPSAAFLVIADGAVVAAWGDVERRYMCHSVRKSFLSALYGVAWDAGRIELNQTLAELGIDDEPDPLLPIEQQARILDLLKARSGVYHPAAYAGRTDSLPRGSVGPGQAFGYNNWDFNTLAAIYRQLTGDDVFEAFDRSFGQPLDMQDWRVRDGYYHYERDKSQYPAYPFRLSARDAARFGLLFARQGSWGERSILSHHWVTRSTALYSIDEPREPGAVARMGYGFMWWVLLDPLLQEQRMATALGVGNQLIAFSPVSDLVIVNRADTYARQYTPFDPLLELIEQVLRARTGTPVADPQLVPLADGPAPAHRTRVDAAALAPFVGTWPHPAPSLAAEPQGSLVLTAADGHLIGTTPTSGHFAYHLQPDGSLIQEDSHARLFVVRDGSGAVDGFAGAEDLMEGTLMALMRDDSATVDTLATLLRDDTSPWALWARAIVAAVRGEHDAPAAMERLAAAANQSFLERVLVQLAAMLTGAGRPEASARLCRQFVASLPGAVAGWMGLGAAEARLGREDDARDAYRRVLELIPGHAEAVAALDALDAP